MIIFAILILYLTFRVSNQETTEQIFFGVYKEYQSFDKKAETKFNFLVNSISADSTSKNDVYQLVESTCKEIQREYQDLRNRYQEALSKYQKANKKTPLLQPIILPFKYKNSFIFNNKKGQQIKISFSFPVYGELPPIGLLFDVDYRLECLENDILTFENIDTEDVFTIEDPLENLYLTVPEYKITDKGVFKNDILSEVKKIQTFRGSRITQLIQGTTGAKKVQEEKNQEEKNKEKFDKFLQQVLIDEYKWRKEMIANGSKD